MGKQNRQTQKVDFDTPAHERKKGKKVEKEDRISRLPDEILIRILSLLTIKDAQMMSVLSTRWRNLWMHITCINFGSILSPDITKCINFVNKVCSSIQSPRIEEFRMISNLDQRAKVSIAKWVDFAMEKGVKNLELIMEKIVHCSDYCLLSYPASISSGIKHLKSLSLKRINISGELLEHFLLHCPSLEHISIQNSKNLRTLKVGVEGQLLNLKFLKIFNCSYLKDLKIFAPKLSNFLYKGRSVSLDIQNVPSLCHVYLGGKFLNVYCDDWAFPALSSYLCQVQTLVLSLKLSLNARFSWWNMNSPQIWALSSLRELTIRVSGYDDCSLTFLLTLVKASPFLEKLRLESHLRQSENLLVEKTIALCPHEYLRVFEIVGCIARPNVVEFVRHLSEAAVRLEKVVIDPFSPREDFKPQCDRVIFTKQFIKRFEELLISGVYQRIEFVL